MPIVIFIFYLIIFSFFILSIPFFRNSQIGKSTLLFLFSIKIAAGIAYAKFYSLPKYYNGSDTWRFYRLSLDETKWLLHDPIAFAKDLFIYNYHKSGNLFSGENTYWNDLKSNAIIKLLAIINVFTNNNYYTNIIFFNFLFLFGLVALFRLLYQIFPTKKRLIIIGIFLFPSALFWCSGIHKDGLILSALGAISFLFYNALSCGFTLKRIGAILICFVIVFALRNYVLFLLLPAIFCWWLCKKYPGKNIVIFASVYTIGIAGLLTVASAFPSINFLKYVANKQHEFLLLKGGSKVNLPLLQPTIKSFALFFPNALDMAFFRPHINEIKNLSYIPAFAENIILLFLLLISLVSYKKKLQEVPLILVLIFFSLSIILVCGYTIPFTGAIVRYKSIVLPLLLTPLLCITDLSFFKKKSK